MIGRATAPLFRGRRRWLRRIWGEANIDTRQKWASVWPYLSALPPRGVRVLDAGCAEGAWLLELACRRPEWSLTGIDLDADAVARAGAAARRLGLGNVEVRVADFLTYRPACRFDLVLSIASAHYLVEAGAGDALFRAFTAWLAPGGRLVLYGPRSRSMVPRAPLLPPPFALRDVLDPGELTAMCRRSGLVADHLLPAVGTCGTLAKQVNRAASGSRALGVASYPVQLALSALDGAAAGDLTRRSSSLLLLARKADDACASGAPAAAPRGVR